MSSPSMRERYREHVRAAVLETAHDLIAERGWERVRMGEIAEAVGVSRALLYKEFGDKPGLGEAVVLREAARFIEGIENVLAHHGSDASSGLAASVGFVLEEAENSPLLRAVLISNRDSPPPATGILPLLTTSAQLLELASGSLARWLTSHVAGLRADEVSDAAEALVRLTVSHLALPTRSRADTARKITEVGLRCLGLPITPKQGIAT
ncbi:MULTISPECIES: TetR/AcrR family transcriptional regulator [Nocardioides]|uniref:TetR family transcriptional regulator n=1 Tax=Nocardioides kribbensis TaxID=305517 RepID=A0ABV1NXN1_9ACTN|nr:MULTISPECIES: TetR family transcriptional regulator [unclassified Nocardioides]